MYNNFPVNLEPGLDSFSLQLMGQSNLSDLSLASYARRREQSYRDQIFMQQVHMRSSRVDGAVTFLANMFHEGEARDKFLSGWGRDPKLRETIGTVLNLPGFSQFLGGNDLNMAFGARSLIGSGMRIGDQVQYGTSPLVERMAVDLFEQLQNRFSGDGGYLLTSQSFGLNRDDLGGILAGLGQRGVLAGHSVGTFDGTSTIINENALEDIGDLVQSSARFVAGLKEIFGDRPAQELMSIAERLTGTELRNANSIEDIARRINRVKHTASTLGLDEVATIHLALQAGDMGAALGMERGAAGTMGLEAARLGTISYRQEQLRAAELYKDSGFIIRPRSQSELVAQHMQDMVGMLSDPMGGRAAVLRLLHQDRSIIQEHWEEYDSLMRDPVNNIGRLTELAGLSGINIDAIDPMYAYARLNEENRDHAGRDHRIQFNKDVDEVIFRDILMDVTRGDVRVAEGMSTIFKELSAQNRVSFFDAVSAGDVDKARTILSKSTLSAEDQDTLLRRFTPMDRQVLDDLVGLDASIKTDVINAMVMKDPGSAETIKRTLSDATGLPEEVIDNIVSKFDLDEEQVTALEYIRPEQRSLFFDAALSGDRESVRDLLLASDHPFETVQEIDELLNRFDFSDVTTTGISKETAGNISAWGRYASRRVDSDLMLSNRRSRQEEYESLIRGDHVESLAVSDMATLGVSGSNFIGNLIRGIQQSGSIAGYNVNDALYGYLAAHDKLMDINLNPETLTDEDIEVLKGVNTVSGESLWDVFGGSVEKYKELVSTEGGQWLVRDEMNKSLRAFKDSTTGQTRYAHRDDVDTVEQQLSSLQAVANLSAITEHEEGLKDFHTNIQDLLADDYTSLQVVGVDDEGNEILETPREQQKRIESDLLDRIVATSDFFTNKDYETIVAQAEQHSQMRPMMKMGRERSLNYWQEELGQAKTAEEREYAKSQVSKLQDQVAMDMARDAGNYFTGRVKLEFGDEAIIDLFRRTSGAAREMGLLD